jgi:hypothetical protein
MVYLKISYLAKSQLKSWVLHSIITIPSLKNMNFLKNLKVSWGPGGQSKKRKTTDSEAEKEIVSMSFIKHLNLTELKMRHQCITHPISKDHGTRAQNQK